MTHPKASIIILDYFKSKRVVQNVESIHAQKVDFPFEVIIVDNSCNPLNMKRLEVLKKYPDVKIVINKKNVGYIRGNNQGVSMSKGDYIFIVNPDIVWRDPLTLKTLVETMDRHPEIGILGPRQINEDDGSIAMTVRAFPKLTTQVARRTWLRNMPILRGQVAYDEMRHLDYGKAQPVDWLQSSFWVTRRSLWEQLGGLNLRYFIFMADPDFCFKCWQGGLRVVYDPSVTVYADGIRLSAGGFSDFFKKWSIRQHLRDSIKYRVVHFMQPNPREQYFRKKNHALNKFQSAAD
jgi:N-acetylglucosaminyl-diphospho-decaprenol L-rhamnosyltransferase